MEKLKEYAIGSSDLTYDLIERILNDGTHLVLSVIDHWKNVVVVEIKNPLNRLHLDSGKAFGQSVGLEQTASVTP